MAMKVMWVYQPMEWVGDDYNGHWKYTGPAEQETGTVVGFLTNQHGTPMAVIHHDIGLITKELDELTVIE